MDPFVNALAFLKSIKTQLSVKNQPYLNRLFKPNNLIKGDLKVTMDNGKIQKFQAFRSQFNNALGPYKGGIRFHQGVTESEVKALSLWMALKCSVAGIPYGGGKGGITVDPRSLSKSELERLSRAYVHLVSEHIGVDKDIPAPDVNTNGQIMAWMLDEYEKIIQSQSPGAFTGKPLELGGSAGREKATGNGGVLALKMLIEHIKKDKNISEKLKFVEKPLSQITIAVQGFGNVGYYFAKIASDMGFRVVAVSDSKGGVYVKEGLDPEATLKCKVEKGKVSDCYCVGGVCDLRKGKMLSNQELLELEVDILVPSALESVIHNKNMAHIKAPIIVEMANGPLTSEADEYLSKKGHMIIPDIFANSGGVTVSYLEWVQNRMGYYWSEEEVDNKLSELMNKAFTSIWTRYTTLINQKKTVTLRKAAYLVAVERIIEAEKLRKP